MLTCDWIIASVCRRLVACVLLTRLNSANTAADWPDTPARQIVGGIRSSMNRSDIRMRENVYRRLPADHRRQQYEPGLSTEFLY